MSSDETSPAVGPPRILRALTWAATGLAVLWLLVTTGTALARIGYPFELEWMGGAFQDHVCRVLDGKLLYVEPTERYVPFLYAPLYFYASAGMAQLAGEGYLASRLVSLLATLATFVLAARLASRLAGDAGARRAGLFAAGAYAAGYVVVDTWYDLTRADSLFVAWSAAALLRLETCRHKSGALAAAALLVTAYFTKQTALLLAPPCAVALAIRNPRLALWFAGGFAVLWAATNFVVDQIHDGWFWYYTFTLPRRHGYDMALFAPFWRHDLLPLYPALLASVVWIARGLLDRERRRLTLSRSAWLSGLLLAGLSSRLHVGGAINVLMPTVLGLAIVTGAACATRNPNSDAGWKPRLLASLGPVLLIAQLLLAGVEFGTKDDPHPPRLFDPRRYVPSEADRAAGEALVERLRNAEGDVLVPLHGYLPRMAGKEPGAHLMAVLDVKRSGEPELWERLEKEFLDSARNRQAELVVLDQNLSDLFPLVVPGYIVETANLFPDAPDRFTPPVGLRARPQTVFRRKP